MVGLLLFEHQIVDKNHKSHLIVRKQHCMGCRKVLAIEVTDKLGVRIGENYVLDSVLRSKAGTDFLYRKETWFGNHIRCLNCGREGKLPMDKPLSAENIAKPKEVINAT